MNKVELITSSVRCRKFGWFSLLPVVGIPFLLLAYSELGRVRREAAEEWNPARRQLRIGQVLTLLGTVIVIATLILTALFFLNNRL